MFVKKKINRSGTTSVVIAEKSKKNYKPEFCLREAENGLSHRAKPLNMTAQRQRLG